MLTAAQLLENRAKQLLREKGLFSHEIESLSVELQDANRPEIIDEPGDRWDGLS